MGRVVLDHAAIRRSLNSPHGPMARQLLRHGNQVRNEALPEVPVDENRLRGDVHVELQTDARGLFCWVGSRLRYAAAVHNGARPHWPPRGALTGWVRRHGMPPQAEFLIRRAIAERGTRAHPFLHIALRRVFGDRARIPGR